LPGEAGHFCLAALPNAVCLRLKETD